MKKTIVLAMLGIASVASADIAVDIVNSAGFLKAGETAPSGTAVLPTGTLVQLIWSASAAGYQTDNLNATLLNAGEYLLFSGNANDVWGKFSLGTAVAGDDMVGGADINSGYFYARIFDTADGAIGSSFLELGLQGSDLMEYVPGPPPDGTTIYSSSFNDTAWTAIDSQGTTVIPEPATIGLVGVAGLGLFLARKKSNRS
ncbi:MAG: PEP-CTERM sorting domain-containing protein [Pontiellaceae bacterium]|nr:PEP-CTERM sorting domain-containing protein [Pontiellaceae bacterium]MBN2784078.1 PEP-CTERM sorting domain-containing protein [Pontiellaceae bacterium]